MAAKDYKICCAFAHSYIAKESKKNSGIMTDDRRIIPEHEILQLIHWWLLDKLRGKTSKTQVITFGGEPLIEIKLLRMIE